MRMRPPNSPHRTRWSGYFSRTESETKEDALSSPSFNSSPNEGQLRPEDRQHELERLQNNIDDSKSEGPSSPQPR
ncbi:MAG: hypothetical protein SFW66_04900 [Gammaproteobacteria bacterium]|nr:hypothetical protein [Gammaproteobacteria bacterium]